MNKGDAMKELEGFANTVKLHQDREESTLMRANYQGQYDAVKYAMEVLRRIK